MDQFLQILRFEILNPTEFDVFESLTLRAKKSSLGLAKKSRFEILNPTKVCIYDLILSKNRVLKSLTLRDFVILGR